MTNPAEKSGSQDPGLIKGQMPTPSYLLERGDTSGSGLIGWIGMRALAFDGTEKDFLLWRNFTIGDLKDDKVRHDLAAFIARLKIEMDADAAIGKPVDIMASNSSKDGKVAVIGEDVLGEEGVFGVYIEAESRPMFNFMSAMRGIRGEQELRIEQPELFERVFKGALEVLPFPEEQ